MTMRSQAIVTLHDLSVDGRRAVLLLDTFGDLDAVLAADHEQLTSIPGLGAKTAQRISELHDRDSRPS